MVSQHDNRSLHLMLERLRRLLRLVLGRSRAVWLGARGVKRGRKVTVGARCRIDRPYRVRLGQRVTLEDQVHIKVERDEAVVELDEFVYLGRGVELDAVESITIGAHTLLGPGCFITDHDHGMAAGLEIDQQRGASGPVTIGRDAWLGAKVVVLPGVTIGDGAIIGAGSVVTRSVEPMTVAVGVPAKAIGTRS